FVRVFYACKIPFSVAENEHMKKLILMLRGGSYKLPTRHDIGGNLIDVIHEECEETLASELEGQRVTLIQDSWSNIHKQFIIGSCLHTGTVVYCIRSVDTGSEKKTAEYCCNIAENAIDYCEITYKCKVFGICSDSENKMISARNKLKDRFEQRQEVGELGNTDGRCLIVYGCAAHFLNLVEKDVSSKTVLSDVVAVQKILQESPTTTWLDAREKWCQASNP
ncbi:unnamed protein product, partial [Meganyctiphanes norvegica]